VTVAPLVFDVEPGRGCIHCGLCNSACPTYAELGTETDGPRGRIYFMRAVTDGRLLTGKTIFGLPVRLPVGQVVALDLYQGRAVHLSDLKPKDVRELATKTYPVTDIGAAISSGSFPTMGMIIAPCSIRTMSEIASGVTAPLLSRAADVVLKEKRRLVLAIRETPLHGGHLRTMTTLADIGAVIAPIVPAFYNRPKSVDDIVNHTCGRLLDLFGVDTGIVKRWKGGPAEA